MATTPTSATPNGHNGTDDEDGATTPMATCSGDTSCGQKRDRKDLMEADQSSKASMDNNIQPSSSSSMSNCVNAPPPTTTTSTIPPPSSPNRGTITNNQ